MKKALAAGRNARTNQRSPSELRLWAKFADLLNIQQIADSTFAELLCNQDPRVRLRAAQAVTVLRLKATELEHKMRLREEQERFRQKERLARRDDKRAQAAPGAAPASAACAAEPHDASAEQTVRREPDPAAPAARAAISLVGAPPAHTPTRNGHAAAPV